VLNIGIVTTVIKLTEKEIRHLKIRNPKSFFSPLIAYFAKNNRILMQIQENILLKGYNSFGINATAKQFALFSNEQELEELLTTHHLLLPTPHSPLILGGGSNILFTTNIIGLVLKNEIHGIEKLGEDEDFVFVKAGAGENWHGLVLYCIEKNWAGLENLSLIPGNVGASPMQNIGAYGVEIKDVFVELEAFHRTDRAIVKFSLEDCAFSYRESVFKRKYRDQFVILSVTYKLRKKPVFNTSYGAVEQELERMGVTQLSIQAISRAVINIRSSKLPDPKLIGNAGSFFKNPQVAVMYYSELKKTYPVMPSYPVDDHFVKVPAGWLIEECGWKGYRRGDAGCHAKQALVLVNYGNASGKEIYDLSEDILQSVEKKFGIELEREVNMV
jgi:UDP-N-acetylmuramate dehydrogenase